MSEEKPVKKPEKITISQSDLQKIKLQNEDLDFVEDCKTALLSKTTPFAAILLYFLIAFIVVGLAWANFAKLDEVTRGIGQIIPASKVQLIQNLEGGILKQIYVKEGEHVIKGQKLVQLSKTQFAAQYQEVYAKYLTMQAAIARLKAEVAGQKNIIFPAELANKTQLKNHELMLFNSRLELQKHLLANLTRKREIIDKELAITEPLVKQGVMSKIDLLRLQREQVDIKNKIDGVKDNFREKALTHLNYLHAEAIMLTEQLSALKDKMLRTSINSPVTGIVKQIYISTVGGVVQAGAPIMDIVPLNDKLVIEAQIKPQDIAFIKVGQDATVRVTAYDYAIYGSLKAKVTHISADSSMDKNGNSFYQVDLQTDKDFLGNKAGKFPLKSGMNAMVDIITGKKSMMAYLLKPILRAKEKAMRER